MYGQLRGLKSKVTSGTKSLEKSEGEVAQLQEQLQALQQQLETATLEAQQAADRVSLIFYDISLLSNLVLE